MIEKYIENHKNEIIEKTQELIQIPSIISKSHNPQHLLPASPKSPPPRADPAFLSQSPDTTPPEMNISPHRAIEWKYHFRGAGFQHTH